AVEGLLQDYGLSTDQPGWQKRIVDGRQAAAFHGGHYLDVPFGIRPDGQTGTLRAFCRDLGVILDRYVARNPENALALAPIISISKTGVSLAQEKATYTRSYEQAVQQMLPQEAPVIPAVIPAMRAGSNIRRSPA